MPGPRKVRLTFHQAFLVIRRYSFIPLDGERHCESGTVRARPISQEYNTFTQPGIIPRPLDLKSIALTFGRRVSHVPHSINDKTSQLQNYFVFSSSIYLTSPCVIIFVFKCMSLHLQSV